jgi:hypothetical protein
MGYYTQFVLAGCYPTSSTNRIKKALQEVAPLAGISTETLNLRKRIMGSEPRSPVL